MNRIKPSALVLVLFLVGNHPSWSQGYREAREKLKRGHPLPSFAEQQIDSQLNARDIFDAPRIESPLTIVSETKTVESQDTQPLEEIHRKLIPYLLTEEGRRMEEDAKQDRIEKYLQSPVRLHSLLAIAAVRNPRVRSASQAWQGALNRFSQAGFLEGILSQYNTFTRQLNTRLGGMQPRGTMLAEQFPFPGVTALRGDIIQTEIDMARQQYAMVLRDVLMEAKLAFHDYVYIRRAIGVSEQSRDLLRQMLDMATVRFEAAQASYSDVLRTRTELAEVETSLLTMREERQTVETNLNTLLSHASTSGFGAPEESATRAPQQNIESLQALARENRQEIRMARLQVRNTELMIDMAEQMNRPDPGLGISYYDNQNALRSRTIQGPGVLPRQPNERRVPVRSLGASTMTSMSSNTASSAPDASMSGGMNGGSGTGSEGSFMTRPEVQPRPWFGERESYIQEMRNRKQEMEHQLQNAINQTTLEVKDSHFEMTSAQHRLNLYNQTLLPDTQQTLEVAQTEYQSGSMDFIDYLEAQRMWLETRMASYDAVRKLGRAVAELEAAVGTTLSANSR